MKKSNTIFVVRSKGPNMLERVPISKIEINKLNLLKDDFKKIAIEQRRSIFVVRSKSIKGTSEPSFRRKDLILKGV